MLTPDAEILRRLRASGNAHLPASALGDPSSVNTRIALLRDSGYQIEHHPHLGYRLLSAPDRVIADDILSRLPECRWLRRIQVFQKTSSTNDLVTAMARDGADPGVVVFAEEQTAGRGRLGRRWESDPSLGLWFSILLRPEMPLAQWHRLTIWLAYALSQGIREFLADTSLPSAPEIMLKWPNDLHIAGRKLAGILVETSVGQKPFATAGIGLNVNHLEFPPPLDATATSLRIQTGVPLDRNALAAAILVALDQSYFLIADNFQKILDWACHADCLIGKWVSATVGPTLYEGTAQGIGPEGALLVRTATGESIRLTSGEVTRFTALRV